MSHLAVGEENRRAGVKVTKETAVKRGNGQNERCIGGNKSLVNQQFFSSLDNR